MEAQTRAELGGRGLNPERLRAGDEIYKRIVESAPEYIFIIERDGSIGYVNVFGAASVKRRPEEMIGRRLDDILPPDAAKELSQIVDTVFRTRKPLVSENFVRMPGWEVWLDTNLMPIFDELGRVDAVLGISRDITNRKETEARLEKSYRIQNVINRLLEISLLDISLDEQLQLAVDIILSAPFMPLQPKGGIFLVEDDPRALVLKAPRGLPESLLTMCGKVPFGECLCGRAAANRRIVFAAGLDERHDHRYVGIVPHGHYNVPILSKVRQGEVLGVIVLYVEAGHKQDMREEEFLQAVANVMAGLIERKQVEETLKVREGLGAALNRINAAINSTLDFDRIMRRVAEDAAKAIGCEAAAVILRDEPDWIIRYLFGLPAEQKGMRIPAGQAKCALLAAETRRPVSSADAQHDRRFSCALMKKLGVRSFLSIPLTVKDDVVGILDFYYRSAPKAFTPEQVDFADKLGASVSLALENARLYAVEHNIADTLQEALLIMADQIPGLDFGYLYRSATEAAEVGGDFYDIFELEDDKVAAIIGDVSGKGLEAATLTSLVKSTMKAYAYQGDSPAAVMKKTNAVICKTTGPSAFVTVFFGLLDQATGTLGYCSAGHPPALIKKRAGQTEALVVHSPVIGVMPAFDYEEHAAELSRGDRLVLYTDGASEARRGNELLGEARLKDLVERAEPASAQALAETVFGAIERFSGGNLADDVALLVVGRV